MPQCRPNPVVKTAIRPGRARPHIYSKVMPLPGLRPVAVLLCAAAITSGAFFAPAWAQSAEQKPPEASKPAAPAGEAGKPEAATRTDQIAEAGRALTGPAANPECVWLGQRVVGLLWRDDLDTAFRHLDLYDRFGCPGGHVQVTFRCVVRQGNIDPKSTETLNARVHTCWINPGLFPTAAAAQPSTAQSGGGTNAR